MEQYLCHAFNPCCDLHCILLVHHIWKPLHLATLHFSALPLLQSCHPVLHKWSPFQSHQVNPSNLRPSSQPIQSAELCWVMHLSQRITRYGSEFWHSFPRNIFFASLEYQIVFSSHLCLYFFSSAWYLSWVAPLQVGALYFTYRKLLNIHPWKQIHL